MISSVNLLIAFTHIRTRKKQTFIASMGVTVGIALFIFSNSIVVGVTEYSKTSMFKSIPHIRIYNEDKISVPLIRSNTKDIEAIVINPKFTNSSRFIIDPDKIIADIRSLGIAQTVASNVTVDVFYKSGSTQVKGITNGIVVDEFQSMFDIDNTMLSGSIHQLSYYPNGIIIGSGIAGKLNVRVDDYIYLLSSEGVPKTLRVLGIFSTNNKAVDDAKSYVSLNVAQQLLKESKGKITDIYIKIKDSDSALYYTEIIQRYTHYKVEDWQTANAEQLAQNKMMSTMTPLISFSILLVAAFGIYNIINMTITQKMNEIAILKANGFNGRDVMRIFITESFIMGVIGTTIGLFIGALLVFVLRGVYVGPPVGYFPVMFEGSLFIVGSIFGLVVSIGAGYIPARKAGKIDPVTIFRK